MNTLIVTGGSIDYKFACEYLKKYTWDYVVCADAGMKFCHTAGIQPDLILGDFDSVDDASYTYFKETCPERMEQFPTHASLNRYYRVVRVLGIETADAAIQQDIQNEKALEEKRRMEQMPKGSIHERLAWGIKKSEMENQQRKKSKSKNREMER